MGCIESRKDSKPPPPPPSLPEEEKILVQAQSNLPLAKVPTKTIIQCFKAEATGETMTTSQLRRAFRELEIDADCLSNPESALYKIIKKTRNKDKLYDTRKLCVMATVLGTGPPEEKARWVFKSYDKDAEGMLSKEELMALIADLFEVSYKILPRGAIGEGPNMLSAEKAEAYTTPPLEQSATIAPKVADKILTEDRVSEIEFAKRVGDPNSPCANLLSPVHFRTLCNGLVEK